MLYEDYSTQSSNTPSEYTTRGLQLDFDFRNGSTGLVDKVNGKSAYVNGTIPSDSWTSEGLTFDGNANLIITDTTTGVYQPTTEFTLEAYVNMSTAHSSSYGDIIGRASVYHFSLFEYGGKASFTVNNEWYCGNQTLTAGTWYHIVGTYDLTNGVAIFYVNGSAITSQQVSGTFPTTAQDGNLYDFNIGGMADLGFMFNGKIAFARYYNVALTSDEVTSNYKSL